MMRFILILVILFSTFAQADTGVILKLLGKKNGYLLRHGEKKSLESKMVLKMGDEIFSQESILLIYIEPNLQISLSRKSHIKLNRSVTDLMKGIVRVRVDKLGNEDSEQKIQTRDVFVGTGGSEFEFMIADSKDVELDVFQGEVVVSSPHVHSFVPEIVKSLEGLTFRFVKKAFLRRKAQSRFKDHLRFLSRSEIKDEKR